MNRWEQYEVWVFIDGNWELRFSSCHHDLAWAVTRARVEVYPTPLRMVRAVYDGAAVTETELIADFHIGSEDG
jgi:hypothetical protein